MKKRKVLVMLLLCMSLSIPSISFGVEDIQENIGAEEIEMTEEVLEDNNQTNGNKVEEKIEETDISVKRISGSDRYKTALEISKNTFEQADMAIIAYSHNFPDAMFGGKLAVRYNMPILLSQKDKISDEVMNELDRLKVKKVYILGGQSAISLKAERQLLNKYSVKRLAGKDRAHTAWEINLEITRIAEGIPDTEPLPAWDFSSQIMASGYDFADALSAAPFVGQLKGSEEVNLYGHYPTESYAFVPYFGDELFYGGAFIIGGPKAVPHMWPSDEYHAQGVGRRIYGANRYATAVEIAKLYPLSIGKEIDTVVLASGLNYPDALAAAPYVSTQNAALLLTHPSQLSIETKRYIQNHKIKNVIVLGGEKAVSPNVVKELESMIF